MITQETQNQLTAYLQRQLMELTARCVNYTTDDAGAPLPRRDVYGRLAQHLDAFEAGNAAWRWLVISGLRGLGKTTLLMQLLDQIKAAPLHKIYLSVDEVTRQLGVTLGQVLAAYETLLGESFTQNGPPVYIFLDEVQYDPDWAITIKNLYDRSRRVFVAATGSAALQLQTNADISRRAIFETIYPLSFREYVRLIHRQTRPLEVTAQLREGLLGSNTGKEAMYYFKRCIGPVRRFYATFPQEITINKYLEIGTLPSLLRLHNLGVAYDQLKKTVDTIIGKDIAQLQTFSPATLNMFARLIYLLTNNDVTAVDNVAHDLRLSPTTLQQMLDTLELSGLIYRLAPYGNVGVQVRKASKYLFAAPAFRSMYLNLLGTTLTPADLRAKVCEDTVAMYLTKLLTRRGYSYALTYDAAKNCADFIVDIHEKQQALVLEVGSGTKGSEQVAASIARHNLKYSLGITVSQSPLQLDPGGQFVNLPLSMFLLL